MITNGLCAYRCVSIGLFLEKATGRNINLNPNEINALEQFGFRVPRQATMVRLL